MNYKFSYLFSNYAEKTIGLDKAATITGLSKFEIKKQLQGDDKTQYIFRMQGDLLQLGRVSPKSWALKMTDLETYPIYHQKERIELIYLLCYSEMESTSVFLFQYFLMVSKGTIINDIKALRKQLAKEELSLRYTRKEGFSIVGKEKIIRKIAKNYIANLFQSDSGKFALHCWLAEIDLSLYARVRDLMEEVTEKTNFQIVQTRIDEINFFIGGSIERIKSKKLESTTESSWVKKLGAFQTSRQLIQHLMNGETQGKNNDLKEYVYFTEVLMTVIKGQIRDAQLDPLLMCSAKIISNMEELTLIEVSNYKNLLFNVFYHLVPAYFRIKLGFRVPNVLIDTIKRQYGDFYAFTKKALRPLQDRLEMTLPEEEIGFFTVLFVGAMYNNIENKKRRNNKAIIVCPNGVSSSLILQSELNKIFPTIDFDEIGSLNDLKIVQPEQYDLIFTTVPLRDARYRGKSFVVAPLMSQKEKNELIMEVQRKVFLPGIVLPTAEEIIDAMWPYIDMKKGYSKEDLYKVINGKINRSLEKEMEDDRPMLSELVTPDMVQITDKELGWEEAIKFAAQPLLKKNFIEERYITAMIDKVKEYGAFINIGEGVALPHARPEEGAKKVGMSILKVKKPVLLLDQEEHAVKLFICLSAVDNTTHLKALASLTNILSDEQQLSALLDANTKEEILTIINKGDESL